MLVAWMLPSLVWAAGYPERIPKADPIAVWGFHVADDVGELNAAPEAAAVDGVKRAGNKALTKLDVDNASNGQWAADDLADCQGDPACLYPIAKDCRVDWLVTATVKRGSDGVIVDLLLADVREERVHRRRLLVLKKSEALADELSEAVAELLLGPAQEKAMDEEDVEIPVEESLAYEVTKWVTLGVGAGLVGTGVAFAIFAKQKQDDYNDTYATEAFIDANKKDEAERDALIANSTLISGGIVLGASVVLFILDGLDVGETALDRMAFGPGPVLDGPGGSLMVRY